jgi:hypothetical protein
MKMREVIHGEKYGEALKTIPLANNRVMKLTDSVSGDIKPGLNAVQNLLLKSTNRRMLFRWNRPGRVHVLPAAFRVMCKANSQRKILRRDTASPCVLTEQRLLWDTGRALKLKQHSSWSSRELCTMYHSWRGFSIACPGTKTMLQATVGVMDFLKSRQLNHLCFVVLCEDRQAKSRFSCVRRWSGCQG